MNDDAKLAHQAQRGDRKAFAMLVERYETPIFNLACRMVRDPDDAADVTQSTFVKAFRKIGTYRSEYRFFSWIYRIAVNEALNHLDRKKRARELDLESPSGPPRPDEECDARERGEMFTRALAAMTLDQRVVIILKHLIFLSYRDIAGILDIPEKTVKSRLYSARQVLREHLVKQGYGS
jgi:RNA polymerase sigma-70 factor (ECF subfamily)